MHSRTRTSALILVIALAASACAGGAGLRTSAAPPSNPAGEDAGAPTARGGPGDAGTAPTTAGQSSTGPARPAATASGPTTVATGAGAGAAVASAGVAGASGSAAGSPGAGRPAAVGPNAPPGPGASAAGSGPATAGSARPLPVPGAGAQTGVTAGTITLGMFFPKTGAYAGLFRNVPVVAQAAFDEAGPVLGRKLVLKTYDDGTSDSATIQTEEKRAKDEVFAMLSAVSESNAVLAPLADRHGVPLIVGNIDEKLALPLTYVFPVLPFWARQAKLLPGFIQNVLGGGGKRIGIVYEGTSTATDAKEAFKAKAGDAGLRVVFEQPIAQNQSACANEVANLQAHRVELVFMMNGPLGATCMLRDARALGYRPTWTGVGVSWEANVVATASGGGADGIRKLTGFATLETPAGRHFAEVMHRYAPTSGAADDDVMLLYYGMLQTQLAGLRRAGPDLTREGFVRTFETAMNGFDGGYLPPPTFGPGNRSGPLAVGVVACCTGGRWTTMQGGWRQSF